MPLEEAPHEKGVHVVGKAIIVIVLCLTGLVKRKSSAGHRETSGMRCSPSAEGVNSHTTNSWQR